MLRYLGLGQRPLGDYPMPPHKRVNWEFLAVIRGKCAPYFRDDEKPVLSTDTLWLFPPGFVHGWIGEPGEKCEVVVIHFSTVPSVLERLATERGHLETRLTSSDKKRLERLGKTLKRHYWHPIVASELHTQRALMDVGLILLRNAKESRKPNESGASLQKVISAENWLRLHLAEKPSIVKTARAVGISASQLRRLFWKVRKARPKHVLNRLRFDKAMRLMSESDAKLHSVAAECGFSSATNLCRAFKAFNGKPPTAWRKEIYIQYKKPRQDEKADHARHGRRYREP